MNTDEIKNGLLKGEVRKLAKAITLIETTDSLKRKNADKLLDSVLPYTGKSLRIGISGVPGVGKSTFIETFGMFLTSIGKRVAVLAVDPSSKISGGSILGDKTRMQELSKDKNAFIRPSPAGDSLGGVARKTRESMLLCESAGYDVIIVETVGVGQSEIAVSSMVDCFVLLQLPGAGDELQGIKKGIMEISDVIVINKSDGDNVSKAEIAKRQIENALHMIKARNDKWVVKTLLVSALKKKGIDEFWETLLHFITHMKNNGLFYENRKMQALDWMKKIINDEIMYMFYNDEKIREQMPGYIDNVRTGKTNPYSAAKSLLEIFVSNK